MGIDVGFDIALTKHDRPRWLEFLKTVANKYKSDPLVLKKADRIEFAVKEHPTLHFTVEKALRFSSKVTGPSGDVVERYINQVTRVAMQFFPESIHPWNEYGDNPNTLHSWEQVIRAEKLPTPHEDLFLLEPIKPTYMKFSEACKQVLRGFEEIHAGMDGLEYESASFPNPRNGGYRVVQREATGSSCVFLAGVSSIDDWVHKSEQASDPTAKKAYWAARCHNNCLTLNNSLLQIMAGKQYLVLDCGWNLQVMKVASLSLREVGLTPHHVSTIVEPPFESRVPPSDDGETFHTFLVGQLKDMGEFYALDCSCAQFGVFTGEEESPQPYIAQDLKFYLKRLGSHRPLKKHEQTATELHPLVAEKIKSCVAAAKQSKAFCGDE